MTCDASLPVNQENRGRREISVGLFGIPRARRERDWSSLRARARASLVLACGLLALLRIYIRRMTSETVMS